MSQPVPEPAPRPQLSTGLNLAVNYGPLLLFFVANKFGDLFIATGVFMAAMVVAVGVSWWKIRHVPPMLLLTFAIVLVFGGLTLWLQDETFIKLKPTLIYGIFAALLFFGLATGRPTLKLVMDGALPGIDAAGWTKLTRNWALFFVAMMVANEVARRMLTTDQWVSFKVWGVTLAFFVFALAQAPLMTRHGLNLGDEPKP
ncbi:septation protein IspZ [Polymorphobacter fuscus]|uniref:Inner membrane-spanning protein YciB n=1 Tax=Sandarakinorhabdus fusca TaxID=1439888 RepID=A0A7C9GP05_9SPHN|nr:septation protein IspZ [Polymorphobacter fuscus]KAB7647851.1 septation protein IspZ [Polymorphobacter fuscus]MQT17157.1 septation protein IspZ [Polymorphobacter fuscus]NJC08850.1 intracellular septation protein [Polymorphobacter fuscus]